MAHFFGSIQGNRGEATRLGSKDSGLEIVAASCQGSVRIRLFERDGIDFATVALDQWHGSGQCLTLYSGPVRGPQEAPKC